jgi:hypothetical protein
MTVLKNWYKLDIDSDNLDSYTDKHDDWNLMFAHHKEEDEIYPLTLTEIADAQITKLARNYLYRTKVYSAKHSSYGRKTHGQSRQSIRMEQSQFNTEII